MKMVRFVIVMFAALFLGTTNSYAISSNVMGKSKYILAEKNFNEKDYKSAIQLLNEAKDLLRQTNGDNCLYF